MSDFGGHVTMMLLLPPPPPNHNNKQEGEGEEIPIQSLSIQNFVYLHNFTAIYTAHFTAKY